MAHGWRLARKGWPSQLTREKAANAGNMNPVVVEIGSITLRHYAAWIIAGVLVGAAIIAWDAYRRTPTNAGVVARWLDPVIAAVVGGLIGARALYVVQEWQHFGAHQDQITKIELGGMAWHGALLLGIPAALLVAWLRDVSIFDWTDAAALAWPVGLSAGWVACRKAGCAYSFEVRTLADFPSWQVAELPDVYGIIEPRFDLQMVGAWFGVLLLWLAMLLTWRNWLPGVRLWLVLALTGLGMHILGYFRADPTYTHYGRRDDQIFDLALLMASTVLGGTAWLVRRRLQREAIAADDSLEAVRDETDAGTGPDESPAW